jgi:hypothetical protein
MYANNDIRVLLKVSRSPASRPKASLYPHSKKATASKETTKKTRRPRKVRMRKEIRAMNLWKTPNDSCYEYTSPPWHVPGRMTGTIES